MKKKRTAFRHKTTALDASLRDANMAKQRENGHI